MARLQHYDDFKKALTNYKVSQRALDALQGLKLVIMVAPTSTGRNTVIGELLKTGDYYFITSDTTREPQVRDGQLEKDGDQYNFRDEASMLADIEKGEFLEAAIIHEQQVSGISIRELEAAKKRHKIAITDIEVVGADNVMKAKPDTVCIFMVPPSYDEWLRRIQTRSQMDAEEVRNRLCGADKEFLSALKHKYYQFVIATDIAATVKKVDAIAKGGHSDENAEAVRLVERIHDKLQTYLDKK